MLARPIWLAILTSFYISYPSKMNNAVFWDTSAFVAIGFQRDKLHLQATSINAQLATKNTLVVTTSAVLIEVANTFSKVGYRILAQQLVERIHFSKKTGLVNLIHVDQDLYQRGWQLFCNRTDKDWSLTDCISFVVMQSLDLKIAFTSDHHFEQAGFVRLMKG